MYRTFYLATAFEAESIEFDTTAHKFEKEVDSVQRDIAKVEDQLDIAISSTKVNYIFRNPIKNLIKLGNWWKTRSRRQGGDWCRVTSWRTQTPSRLVGGGDCPCQSKSLKLI